MQGPISLFASVNSKSSAEDIETLAVKSSRLVSQQLMVSQRLMFWIDASELRQEMLAACVDPKKLLDSM